MTARFDAPLVEWDGPAAWHFVEVPPAHAPDFAGAFGRVPVIATVDGTTWHSSVWREKSGRWMLPVPKKVRRHKVDGDTVSASVEIDTARL